jgi:hypothetical protein
MLRVAFRALPAFVCLLMGIELGVSGCRTAPLSVAPSPVALRPGHSGAFRPFPAGLPPARSGGTRLEIEALARVPRLAAETWQVVRAHVEGEFIQGQTRWWAGPPVPEFIPLQRGDQERKRCSRERPGQASPQPAFSVA